VLCIIVVTHMTYIVNFSTPPWPHLWFQADVVL